MSLLEILASAEKCSILVKISDPDYAKLFFNASRFGRVLFIINEQSTVLSALHPHYVDKQGPTTTTYYHVFFCCRAALNLHYTIIFSVDQWASMDLANYFMFWLELRNLISIES